MWDIIVVGGGPAGMMAAGRASEKARAAGRPISVLLLEKNDTLGKKLLITGGGRCNVTNAEPDLRTLLSKFKESDQFLFSAFSQYGVPETLTFFHSHGMPTKVEAHNRVFPKSDTAQSVWNVLVDYMKQNDVTVLSHSPVAGFTTDNEKILSVLVGSSTNSKNTKEYFGKSFILATGGKSRPETGSTGDGFAWLQDFGHTVVEPDAALVPISLKNAWVPKLAGITLPEVKITVLQNNEKQLVKKGRVLFTHVGMSGPTILNMSKDIGELLKYGDVVISLDLLPSHDFSTLNDALQELFKKEHLKQFKNSLDSLIPAALASVIVAESKISAETRCNSITREQRITLMKLLKDLRVDVKQLLGTNKAIVTSGGVTLSEIDFKTMRSRLIPNLHIVGDMLNIDRPSGGYSLQLCWTTGYVAGDAAAAETTKSTK
jgi:predicted Rossmann fold flavoprotein